jgi:GTPase Era involved in 16S rRNA processing
VTIDQFEEVATGRPTGRPKAGEEIAEPERDLLRIACSILVDRASQKPILIGKGGEMIKRIGTAARLEIQKFFGTRVFLDLVVKVAPDWRENERVLDDLGIPGTRRKGGARPGRRSGRR